MGIPARSPARAANAGTRRVNTPAKKTATIPGVTNPQTVWM